MVAETPHYLVVFKPSGLATVPLKSDGPDKDTLLSRVAKQYSEVVTLGRNGWEGGVLHRLDTNTCGLVVIARTQEAFSSLRSQQEAGLVIKQYLAVSSLNRTDLGVGFPVYPYGDVLKEQEVVIGSLFRPFGDNHREVRPVTNDCPRNWKDKSSGSWYLTRVRHLEKKGEEHRFLCTLNIGFRHQVRVHMAWSGWPLDGDELYFGLGGKSFGLTAISVQFTDPGTGKPVKYEMKGVRYE